MKVQIVFVVVMSWIWSGCQSLDPALNVAAAQINQPPSTAVEAAKGISADGVTPKDGHPQTNQNIDVGNVSALKVDVPEIHDLANLPLGNTITDQFRQFIYMQVDSTLADGAEGTYIMDVALAVQAQPNVAEFASVLVKNTGRPDHSTETASVGGTTHFYTTDNGCFSYPTDSSQESLIDAFLPMFEVPSVGVATLLETNVEIHGILTDRYALDPTAISSEIDMASSDIALLQVDIYVARETSYIVRFRTQSIGLLTANTGDFTAGAEAKMTVVLDYIPLDQPLDLVPPIACVDQIDTVSTYLKTADASRIITSSGELFYQSEMSPEDIIAFYHAEMGADGWMLTSDAGLGQFSTLHFSRGDEMVQVSLFKPVPDNDVVNVTVSQ
ncbi:MAG: hypothetical protein AAF629_15585 [Chloroflexota bacterium]